MRKPRVLVVDRRDALAQQVREVSAELRPRPEVVDCQKVGSVGDVLREDGPFDVLIAGPSLATHSGLARLSSLQTQCPALSLVLAFSERPDANLRDIVQVGAVDLLQLPVRDDVLLDTLTRAIEVAGQRATPAAAEATATTTSQLGKLCTVVSATGGCGKTFYAVNMAYFLHRHSRRRVCVVDLDVQFGELATALRLRPQYTIVDLLARHHDREADMEECIDEYVVTHDTGIAVLAAPKDPADADEVQPADVGRVLQALRARFDWVVVDGPAALNETVLSALDLSDQIHVLANFDVPSLRNMNVFLDVLRDLKISSDAIRLVLNRVEDDVGIDVDQVTKLFPQGFLMVIPYGREATRSMNLGTPVLALAPHAPVSRRLAQGMVPLLDEEDARGAQAAVKDHDRLLSRLLRRRRQEKVPDVATEGAS